MIHFFHMYLISQSLPIGSICVECVQHDVSLSHTNAKPLRVLFPLKHQRLQRYNHFQKCDTKSCFFPCISFPRRSIERRSHVLSSPVVFVCLYTSLAGGFKYFLFSSLPGEMIQFDDHIFQLGWFNHQLVHVYLLMMKFAWEFP